MRGRDKRGPPAGGLFLGRGRWFKANYESFPKDGVETCPPNVIAARHAVALKFGFVSARLM